MFYSEVTINRFGCQLLRANQREFDPEPLQSFPNFLQLGPEQMSAESTINVIDLNHILASKERVRFRRLNHVYENEMLTREKIDMFNETLRQGGIVERGEENEQCAPAQSQS